MEKDTAMKFSKGSRKSANGEEARQELSGIRVPHRNDVLMGRGGKNNQHLGNETFRDLARDRIEAYRTATKKGKSDLSRELVHRMRSLDPPARFLRKDPETEKWYDVGDDIAREKASQVLRDSVAEKNGPLSQARKKSASPPCQATSRIATCVSSSSSSKEVEEAFDPTTISLPRRSSTHTTVNGSRTVLSSVAAVYLRDKDDVAHFGPSTSYAPIPYPNVTPATDQVTRKRLRSTPPIFAFNSADYVSPNKRVHDHWNARNIPMGSPVAASLCHTSHSLYSHPFSPSSMSIRHTPASASIPEHYASRSGRGNQPWMADVNSHPRATTSLPSVRLEVHVHEFDPYNEDILSDHSDHGERPISPIVYPKCDSL